MKPRELAIGVVLILLLLTGVGQRSKGGSMLGVDVRAERHLGDMPINTAGGNREGQVFERQDPAPPSGFYKGANFFDLMMSERSLF